MSFGGLFWPPKNGYNVWTIANISTEFCRCITYMVRNLEICEKISKMAANMAAEILNQMYLSSPFEYRDK